jgi:hypothetical protein
MTPAEAYTLALVLGAVADVSGSRDLCQDIAVDLALCNDFTFEERLAMRDAAAMVLRTRHPEVELLEAVRIALGCYLSELG